MQIGQSRIRRQGVIMAEAAIVLPILFTIVLGIALVGLGVFRYQQVATVAREAARWASVHGGQRSAETGQAKATPAAIYDAAIKPFASALDASGMTFGAGGGSGSALSFTVSWLDANQMPTFKDANGNTVINTVTVSITYNWIPEGLFGAATFKSTSVMAMSH